MTVSKLKFLEFKDLAFVRVLLGLTILICLSVSCRENKWLKKETAHFIVYYKPESYAARNIERACHECELNYSKMRKDIPIETKGEFTKIRLFLHEQQQENKLGWAHPKRREIHHMYSQTERISSAHEMMHVYLRDINPNVPLRFEEGVCRYFEKQRITLDSETASCQFYRLAKLEPQSTLSMREVFSQTYETKGQACVAAAFVSFLMKRLGSEKFWDVYTNLTGKNYNYLLQRELNMKDKQINAEFRKYVASLKDPPALFKKLRDLSEERKR